MAESRVCEPQRRRPQKKQGEEAEMRGSGENSINVSTWLSLRFERDTRYFQLHLEQDLWGAWILIRVNGRRDLRLGRALMGIH
jgi:hypothetical protein